MSRIARLLLTWLLAAALPLQGLVVHAAEHCKPAQHHEAVAEHDHAAMGHTDAQVEKKLAGKAGKCSACAACCQAAAIATDSFRLEPVRAMPVTVAVVPLGHSDIAPEALERPPRPDLA